MISQNAKNVERALLDEPHAAVMFSCRTLPRSRGYFAEPSTLPNLKPEFAEG